MANGHQRPREMPRGVANRGAPHFVRRRIPPVEVEGVTRGLKDRTTVDRRRRRIETQAHPFDHRREMPGIDRPAIDRSLAAHRVEARAIGPGRSQRMAGHGRIEPGEGGGGTLEIARERVRQGLGTD